MTDWNEIARMPQNVADALLELRERVEKLEQVQRNILAQLEDLRKVMESKR